MGHLSWWLKYVNGKARNRLRKRLRVEYHRKLAVSREKMGDYPHVIPRSVATRNLRFRERIQGKTGDSFAPRKRVAQNDMHGAYEIYG